MTSPAPFPKALLRLDSPAATLEKVGGKGANLARLARAGFNVPRGFFIPTEFYKNFVIERNLDIVIRDALHNLDFNDPAALEKASKRIQTQFKLAPLPKTIRDNLIIAYGWIGAPPVAVRSSATAEDLPDLSFAGQQDTYLNIIGAEALADAVVACWGSLWTARAIGYRARNEIPQEDVSLAVVVQEMAQAEVSGVMFTANPLTGKRDEIVIDAAFGLGEALVSGLVEPDNYVVSKLPSPALPGEGVRAKIQSKTLGAKATVIRGRAEGGVSVKKEDNAQIQALPDEIILQLAEIGAKIAAEYDFPQDIEWAYLPNLTALKDLSGFNGLYILQSRPITSLFPLPQGSAAEPLQVFFGFHLVQGIIEPLTPLGLQTMQNVLAGAGNIFGGENNYKTQKAFPEAGERLWLNLSAILRNPLGHKHYPNFIKSIDPAAGQIFETLTDDPRLAPIRKAPNPRAAYRTAKFVLPFIGRIIAYWRKPEQGAETFFAQMDEIIAETHAKTQRKGNLWENLRQNIALWHETRLIFPDFIIPKGVSAIIASLAPFFGILRRFSKEIGEPQLYLEISRGLPHNVTTEMDLFLWRTAQEIAADTEAKLTFAESDALQLAAAYKQNTLPDRVQKALDRFISRYGMRGLGEIDLGRPRWREEPTHIIQILQSYLTITEADLAPSAVFARGAEASEIAGKRLESRVRSLKGGRLKASLTRWAIRRYRALAGLREAPKFFAIQMLGIVRQKLLQSGKNLADENFLEQEDDLFFLKIDEIAEIAEKEEVSEEIREKIHTRRAARAREMRRKRLPRVFLSDGRTYYEGMRSTENVSGIFGDPVSPGIVEGRARVVLNPRETQLQVGEILVCPATDPAWTPLFLAAAGLVMEVGGMMTHGSVVAREYGIPAVVGVHEATTRLKTGQLIRVDGGAGIVEILDEEKNERES